MSLNRFPFKTAALAAAILSTSLVQAAGRAYNEPTRGFFIEHGEVAPARKASVELQTGSDGLGNGGGIRLGLENAELLINSGMNDYDQNELLLKWGLPKGSNSSGMNWALLGGISHIDFEEDDSNDEYKQTNLKLGVALTIRADAGIFTIAPQFVYADGEYQDGNNPNDDYESIDDSFLELGLGAYLGLLENSAGKFSIGAEATITTQDEEFGNDSDADNSFALGMKWAYNEHIHLDIVPFIRSDNEWLGIPGLVRLNVAF